MATQKWEYRVVYVDPRGRISCEGVEFVRQSAENRTAFVKRYLDALGEEGWAGKLAGEKLDSRIRYKDIPDDRIYAANNPREAIKLLAQLLPVYNARNAVSVHPRDPSAV